MKLQTTITKTVESTVNRLGVAASSTHMSFV